VGRADLRRRRRRDPELSRAFWDTPGDVAAPEGESFFAVGARVPTAIAGLARDHPGADLIAVAHMGVILAISAFACGLGLKPCSANGSTRFRSRASTGRRRLDRHHDQSRRLIDAYQRFRD
jgi:hypothetical protein